MYLAWYTTRMGDNILPYLAWFTICHRNIKYRFYRTRSCKVYLATNTVLHARILHILQRNNKLEDDCPAWLVCVGIVKSKNSLNIRSEVPRFRVPLVRSCSQFHLTLSR